MTVIRSSVRCCCHDEHDRNDHSVRIENCFLMFLSGHFFKASQGMQLLSTIFCTNYWSHQCQVLTSGTIWSSQGASSLIFQTPGPLGLYRRLAIETIGRHTHNSAQQMNIEIINHFLAKPHILVQNDTATAHTKATMLASLDNK